MKANGKYAVGKIKVELKEFYKKSDMVLANLHTMSDKAMLESGGMIYITATNNGEKLELKKNSKITIEFATKNNKSGMQVFYGHPKGKGIDWNTNQVSPLIEGGNTELGGYTIWVSSNVNGNVRDTIISKIIFDNIPVGRKAPLVAFSSIDDETYISIKDIVIDKKGPIALELQKTTLEDLKSNFGNWISLKII